MEVVDQVAGIACRHRSRGPDPPCGHCVGSAKKRIAGVPAEALEVVARYFAGGAAPTPLCYVNALDLLTLLRPYLSKEDA